MTQSEEGRRLLWDSAPVKIMEKGTHLLVVDNFSRRTGIGMGEAIESPPFVVGGYSFTMHLYPDGANPDSHSRGNLSLFLKNESPKAAQLVYDLHIVGRNSSFNYGHFSFGARDIYHLVDNVPPGTMVGKFHFVKLSSIQKKYALNDCILIRATIGVLSDHHHDHYQPLSSIAKSISSSLRCIVFQVGDQSFYELESVITGQCRDLLSDYPQYNNTVVISDVDPDVFKAVLWFLNNKLIDLGDQKAIANRNGLFALKMLAAADKFYLKDLRRQICEFLVMYRNIQVLYDYFEVEDGVKELWRRVSCWMPQKIKAA